MSDLPENLSLDIRNLSYEELEKLEEVITLRKASLYESYRDNLNNLSQIERQKREKYIQEFQNNILPKIKTYLIHNLVPNKSIIKVKGARDGKGIRLFLGFIGKNEYFQLECRQIKRYKRFWPQSESGKITEELGQITQHMVDKVTHIEINGEFVSIKKLI